MHDRAGAGWPAARAMRPLGTISDALPALADWLAAHAVTHGAMASTGVCWQPVSNLLAGQFARRVGTTLRHDASALSLPGR